MGTKNAANTNEVYLFALEKRKRREVPENTKITPRERNNPNKNQKLVKKRTVNDKIRMLAIFISADRR